MVQRLIPESIKNEKGSYTIITVFIMLGILLLFGLFINLLVTYTNISFSKKALDEAVRSRAMAIDVPLKETKGIVEVINYPHSGSNHLYENRPLYDDMGNPIPGIESEQYKKAVEYAEIYAKNVMIMGVNSFVGKEAAKKQGLIEINPENICFDVKPLPETEDEVTFACALKSATGKIYTVKKTVKLKGYRDGEVLNEYYDDTKDQYIRVNNVVFGAAVIEPKPLYRNALLLFGYDPEKTRTFIYSIAYPQIDKCYGSFC